MTEKGEVAGTFTKHKRPKIVDKILSRGIKEIEEVF